ncbi:MAG: hypothetical protein ACPLN0_06880 [Candidatus Hydrothermia bacterium]
MRKSRVIGFTLLVLLAGCNLRVEEWNEHKILPIGVALPLDTDTFTLQEFVEKNSQYLSTISDTIFYGEDTVITNQFLAIDSTVVATFSHGLPEDILDTSRTVLNLEVCLVRTRVRFKGEVLTPCNIEFLATFSRGGSEVRADTTTVSLTPGTYDTLIILNLYNVPVGSFSITIRGRGTLGTAHVDTMELSYQIPLMVNFRGDTIVFKEVVTENDSSIIDWANKELIDTILLGGNVWNRIPLGLNLQVWVLNKAKNDSVMVLGQNIPAAILSGGLAAQESNTEISVVADRRLMEFLKQDTMYFHILTYITAGSGECVTFRSQDYLRYSLYLRVKGNLDFEKLSE